ncbi:P-loop containing nucleoside triphosphate hydrolase protein [Phycomyces blakesleeanus]|uniref:KH type-2 domain-containing protein n=2 Tax=Phycomyces blakesleeanus TaxID=4837 RepID=A0A163DYX2_PHYB8|nr:hypothetical protein PHYBLDRAFT_144719 [Phycomyces blakesleeanus NRRL 1555(-)]OAD74270.1 hypothetical protein PHYBLDRAFT_144719 [Phycomyces blakesleeanus NRRL 1555(-)]|eukprot:XP_018292310.1 hypothetical protein PHYBLDRAFT_144719 [Phycomyces blakesleeanus NRRL 1555(-)]
MTRAKHEAGVPLELIKPKKGARTSTARREQLRSQNVPEGILKKSENTWKTNGLAAHSTYDENKRTNWDREDKINSFNDIDFVNNRHRTSNNSRTHSSQGNRYDDDQAGFQRGSYRQNFNDNDHQNNRDYYGSTRERRYNNNNRRTESWDDGYDSRHGSESQGRNEYSRKENPDRNVYRDLDLKARKEYSTVEEGRIKENRTSTDRIKRERNTKEAGGYIPSVLNSMKTREPAGLSQRLIKIVQNVTQPENPHSVKVAVIGEANAGKSTLINKIVGEQVTVVSSKAHTTRERILAVLSQDNYQVVFLDTPGIVPDNSGIKMNRTLLTSAWRSLDEADHVVILVDSRKALMPEARLAEESIIAQLKKYSIPATLVFNKMDLLDSDDTILEEVTARYKEGYCHIKQTLYVSALKESGLTKLKDSLFSVSQPKEWAYPKELKSEMSDLKRVEELIRVEFFKRLHQYIPYMLKQENVGWTETEKGIRIDQTVYVERDSQQKIVVGAKGAVIDQVVQEARTQISLALNRPVQLYIQVRTKKH